MKSGDDDERRTWHGMNHPKPKLPYYLRPSKRLKSLNEFEEPYWKGQLHFGEEDRVTFRGIARETLQFLTAFLIIGIIGASAWRSLHG